MGKKKKKEKKKKVVKSTQNSKITAANSLNVALHETKNTETTLQSLMKEVSEEKGFVKKGDKEKIRPHLSHEHQKEIAEAYALEGVPIAQRKQTQKNERTLLVPEPKKKADPKKKAEPKKKTESKKSTKKKPEPAPLPKIQVEVSVVPTPVEEKSVESSEDLAPTPPIKETPIVKKDNIYIKLSDFFEQTLLGYNERYERWENSISNILAIMRKMRKITKKNTEDLVTSINNIFNKIQRELELFKVKRNEVERVAEVDIESMSAEFKRVLGLLELQVKEYQLKRVTDELIHIPRY